MEATIGEKLQRLDKASRHGDWTLRFLKLIEAYPMLRAGELAAKAGVEKAWLKGNIRKLKNLGLTLSLESGYELTPRGHAYLKGLEADGNTAGRCRVHAEGIILRDWGRVN